MKITLNITSIEVENYLKGFPVEEHGKKVEELLDIGVAVMQRVSVNRDMEFVRKETEKMLEGFNSTILSSLRSFTDSLEEQVSDNFNPDVKDSYLGKSGAYLRDLLKDQREGIKESLSTVSSTVKLMLDNSKEVSTDKLDLIQNQLENVADVLNPQDPSSYLGIVKKAVEDFQKTTINLVDANRTDSFTYLIKEETKKYFGVDSPILNSVYDIINEFTTKVNESIIGLREEIAQKKGEQDMLSKTAIKGFDFEEQMNEVIATIAAPYSDVVTFVGKDEEKGTSKKGDFMYETSDGYKIVIECKDQKVGMKPMLTYMKEAIDNRDADMGILVTKYEDQLPTQVGLFNFYEENKIFCSSEDIDVALKFAKLYLAKIKQVETSGEINKSVIEGALSMIKNKLAEFAVIKKKLTGMVNNCIDVTEDVGKKLDEIKSQISENISIASTEMEKA